MPGPEMCAGAAPPAPDRARPAGPAQPPAPEKPDTPSSASGVTVLSTDPARDSTPAPALAHCQEIRAAARACDSPPGGGQLPRSRPAPEPRAEFFSQLPDGHPQLRILGPQIGSTRRRSIVALAGRRRTRLKIFRPREF